MHFLCFFVTNTYLCDKEKGKELRVKPHLFDWETHQFFSIPRHSSCRQWRAAPFGVCFAQRITKVAKHSNPVIRSLFTSTVRLFFIYKGKILLLDFPFFIVFLFFLFYDVISVTILVVFLINRIFTNRG